MTNTRSELLIFRIAHIPRLINRVPRFLQRDVEDWLAASDCKPNRTNPEEGAMEERKTMSFDLEGSHGFTFPLMAFRQRSRQ